MVVAEDIREAVLEIANESGRESFRVDEVARRISPENWEDLLDQVKLVVESMVKEGKVQSSTRPQSFRAS